MPEIVKLQCQDGSNLYIKSSLTFAYGDHPDRHNERKVFTQEYVHTVSASLDLAPEMYSWEWTPDGWSFPHMHVRRADPAFKGLGKLHLPTGRVFFESVLLFLITDHGLKPVKDDGEAIIRESLRRVMKYSSWGGGEDGPGGRVAG